MAERKDRIRVHIGNREYYVVGGSFQEMLTAVKQINGRRFVSDLKVWQLPGTAETIQAQLDIGGYSLEGGTPVGSSMPATPEAPAGSPASGPAGSGADRIRVLIQGHQLAVVGGSFQQILAVVKGLPGRRFDGASKLWEIPGELAIIKTLVETAGFQLEGTDKIPSTSGQAIEQTPAGKPAASPPYEPPDFSGEADAPPYEPPDWWDDETTLPPAEPPDWWDEDEPLPPAQPGSQVNEAYGSEGELFDSEDEPGSRVQDQVRIRLGGIPLVISGGSFQEMLALIKKMPGRRFDNLDKVWDLPADMTLEAFKRHVQTAGFVVKRY